MNIVNIMPNKYAMYMVEKVYNNNNTGLCNFIASVMKNLCAVKCFSFVHFEKCNLQYIGTVLIMQKIVKILND